MSQSTTQDRLRRWRTPIVSAVVAGGLLLGGYGIAAAADSGTSTPDSSESTAPDSESGTPESPDSTAPDRVRPGQPGQGEGRGGPGCDEEQQQSEDGATESSATT
ncbi:hypothetical protein [Jiangella anatolica]|uniref:Uncharacterized protein n=1 Tax=Jiangella anatolica TaxID=2670374 RepID=A0A2W2AXH8_9ACTN|nr:hypothetical protein [Jiangella anatolica]PZF79865.1 hypothetical protein C1I92_29080 [Jiangella anatolica]